MTLVGTVSSIDGTLVEVAVVGANELGNHVTGAVTVQLADGAA